MADQRQVQDGSTVDLLRMFDGGCRRKGFFTRICYYCFVAVENKTEAKYPSLEILHRIVINSARVKDAIEATVENQRSMLDDNTGTALRSYERDIKDKVEAMAKDMIGTVTSRVIKFCGWIYLVMLKKVCGSVQFCPTQLDMIQQFASSNVPIIYMPLHYSHLDYILLSLVLFHNSIRVPYIASGNNLCLPIVAYFIKRAGGFFIRRKLDENKQKDLLYRAVLQSYLTEILKTGQSMEVFIEGTRSRSGLPNSPKTGLLSVLVDAVVEKQIEDAVIVPVHTSYEKLLEGNFCNELLGKPKKAESLWDTFKSVFRILFGHYGSIKINFAKPILLKTALTDICMYSSKDSSLSCLPSPSNDIATDLHHRRSSSPEVDMSWRKNISYLAEHIIFHGMHSASFMPTHLVAFLLLNRWRDGVVFDDLLASYRHFKTELASKGRDLGFSGDASDVILHALSMLGDKVISIQCVSRALPNYNGSGDASITVSSAENDTFTQCGENADSGIFINCDIDGKCEVVTPTSEQQQMPELIIKPIVEIPAIYELSYYSNALTPVFAMESIICLAVNAVTGFRFSMIQDQWALNNGADIFEDSLPDNMRRSFLRSTLTEKALELCDFLQMDLLLCDVIVDIEDCVQDTIQNLISSGCLISKTIGCSKLTHSSYGIDEEDNFGDDELLKVNSQSVTQLLCFQSVLAAYVEALTLVTEQLGMLQKPMPSKKFLTKLLEYSHSRTKSGLTQRIECCSSEVLQHCIRAFKTNKVIETNDQSLVLAEECQNPAHLNKLFTKICQFLM